MVEKDILSCHKHGTKKKFYFSTVSTGDFGISRILMGTSDMATTFTGTPYYMSPEVLKHEGYKYKSDIWYDFVFITVNILLVHLLICSQNQRPKCLATGIPLNYRKLEILEINDRIPLVQLESTQWFFNVMSPSAHWLIHM